MTVNHISLDIIPFDWKGDKALSWDPIPTLLLSQQMMTLYPAELFKASISLKIT